MPESEARASRRAMLEFTSLGEAQVIQGFLESEGVKSFLEVVELSAGVPSRVVLELDPALAHRARWLLSGSEFSERELTYLATGELETDD